MLLRELHDRIKQHLSARMAEWNRRAAGTAKRDRTDKVADLHHDVSRLQHAIADLSQPSENNRNSDDDPTADDGLLAALQGELDRTQRELARFQGRI